MTTLAILEVIDRDGHVRQAVPIHRWPATAGRALDNDLVLDDAHTAAHHFHIDVDEQGRPFVQVGDTINGLRAGGLHWVAQSRVPVGDAPLRVDAGDVHLRLRLASHALAPEQPYTRHTAPWHHAWPVLTAGVLVLAGLLFNTWLDNDPGELPRAYGSLLTGALGAALLWCGAWALVSKVFTRRSHFWWHVRVLLVGVLANQLVSTLAMLLAFSLSLPFLSDFAFVPAYAIAAAMLYFHVLGIEPRHPARMRVAAASIWVAGLAMHLWFNVQNRDQLGDELYMSHLFPPSWRWAGTLDTDTFLGRVAPLQAKLEKQAKKRDGGEDSGRGLDEE